MAGNNRGVHGTIEVICGSMFSGKTEELLRRVKRAQIGKLKVQMFKPKVDTRFGGNHIQSHDSERIPSAVVRESCEILNLVDDNTRLVGIDEVQFFDPGIVGVTQKLAYRGMRVILAGLDMDFRGEPFGPIPHLLAIAEEVTKLSAVCVVCGGQASRSQRLRNGSPSRGEQIIVGAGDLYEARCRFCHEPDLDKIECVHVGLMQGKGAPSRPRVRRKVVAPAD